MNAPLDTTGTHPRPLALLVAGGTGGHIMPGLAVAHALQVAGWQVIWAGNPEAMEGRLVPSKGIVLHPLQFAGFRGKNVLQKLLMPWRLVRALYQAICILRNQQPQVVLGLGGYVALPMGLAAFLCRIPLVVHEQNAHPGLTNVLLARIARRVLVAFPQAFARPKHAAIASKIHCVGNPIDPRFTQCPSPHERQSNATSQEQLKLLVLGGSLGAQALNAIVPKAIALLPELKRPAVVHQSGKAHLAELQKAYADVGVAVEAVDFIDNVAQAMMNADLVICRAGAMTVAEVAACGVAALFVPFPFAVDDHQTANAQYLCQHQAAWMRQQHELTPEWLAQFLSNLDSATCMQMANKARTMAKTDAAQQVVQHLETFLLEHS